MNKDRPGEARLEVALAQVLVRLVDSVPALIYNGPARSSSVTGADFVQAIINEVKYGTETSQLAEVSLLAAFQNRVVGGKLVQALLLLMPGLKYFRYAGC